MISPLHAVRLRFGELLGFDAVPRFLLTGLNVSDPERNRCEETFDF